MMHFPPVQIPPISEKFSNFLNFFYNFTFSRKISLLSSAKISDHLFLVIDHKFRISPLFSLYQYISPLFRPNYSFPLLLQISPPVSGKFTCFLHTLRVFFSPYFRNRKKS